MLYAVMQRFDSLRKIELSVLQSKLKRHWSFSGLASMVRIVLMYYLNIEKFLNQPDADLKNMLADASGSPPQPSLFDCGGLESAKTGSSTE